MDTFELIDGNGRDFWFDEEPGTEAWDDLCWYIDRRHEQALSQDETEAE